MTELIDRQTTNWLKPLLASITVVALFLFDFDAMGLSGSAALLIDVVVIATMGVLSFYSMMFVGSVIREAQRS